MSNSPTQSVSPDAARAAGLLGELRHLEHQSKSMLSAVWFPLLVGGIVSLASGPAISLIDRTEAPAYYWAFGGPVIGIACAVFYATRRIQPPAGLASVATVTAVVMVAGALLLGTLTSGDVREAAPLLVIGVGLGVFGVLYRSLLVVAVGAAHLGIGWYLGVSDPADPYMVSALVTGLAGCIAGVASLLWSHSADG